MGTEIIHARVEPTEPDRTKGGYGYYRTLRIHEVSGKPRDLHKVSAYLPFARRGRLEAEREFHAA